MRYHKLLVAAVSVALGTGSARAEVLVPEGMQPGDTYHLVYVTEGDRHAGSTDIADYNAFVQAQAERAGAITEHFAIDWFAIGSTETIDARDNAIVEGPVYLLDGQTKVADGFEDMWDGSIDAPITLNQFDASSDPWPVITGTSPLGFAVLSPTFNCPLGSSEMCIVVTSAEAYDFRAFGGNDHFDNDGTNVFGHMYALSEKLAVPLEPTGPALHAGDADMDLDFDQFDLVQVQQAAKYLTGEPATWGEGDWNGGPGGYPGEPPPGNGLFDQKDIVAALQTGAYLSGAYVAIRNGGVEGDDQTSIIYDARTGEVAVDVAAGEELTNINIDSASCIFTGEPAQNLGGSFDNDTDCNIFWAIFNGFHSYFGNVAVAGLSEEFVANDLTVVGSLAGGGDLGDVDFIYIPEPSSLLVALLGIVGLLPWRRWRK